MLLEEQIKKNMSSNIPRFERLLKTVNPWAECSTIYIGARIYVESLKILFS